MPRSTGREATVGAFLALALIILAFGIMAVGGESRLFSRKASYRVVFPSTDGLIVGSPVKMGGVQVGTVTYLKLPTDPGARGVEVSDAGDHRSEPRAPKHVGPPEPGACAVAQVHGRELPFQSQRIGRQSTRSWLEGGSTKAS